MDVTLGMRSQRQITMTTDDPGVQIVVFAFCHMQNAPEFACLQL